MTRIVGLLSWWDESPTWLAATVTGMARFCDHIVALDGRYALYPDRRVWSGCEESYAIVDAARAAGVGFTLSQPGRPYLDEMAKRTHLFQLGAAHARTFEDWFFVCDADEVVVESPSRERVIAHLEDDAAQGRDVVQATYWEKADPHESEQRSELSRVLPVDWRYECSTPRFWRALQNMRVESYHYNYLGENESGKTVELWGQDNVVRERALWGTLCGHVVMENRNTIRARKRNEDREAYYKKRDALGIERIVPLDETTGVVA
jgi:hypothetical protein